MRILFLGDVVGRSGRDAVIAALPGLRAALRLDLVVVNGENASHGFGLAPDMARALLAAGADVITLGNHAWDRKEIIPFLEAEPRVIRPANFPPGTPGRGAVVVDVPGNRRALVVQRDGPAVHGCAGRSLPRACRPRCSSTGWAPAAPCHAMRVDMHAEASREKPPSATASTGW